MLLEGKTVLLTGGARGLGAAIAQRMVLEGATVAITDILESEGKETAERIGDQAVFMPLNVTDEHAWTVVVDELLNRTGKIDVLVNNAAILHMGIIENTSSDQFRRLLEVNTTGPFLGMRTVVRPMKSAGSGSIINITSVDSLLPLNGLSGYIASKWALRGLSKSAALELGRDGIRVNCVCPVGGNDAMFSTWQPHLDQFGEEITAYGNCRGIQETVALEEMADAVVFLGSELSRKVTGIDLPVDGGHTAGTYLEAFNTQ
jgi:3alpha(or 20beta)-hydroxysteroid dehydrogenase